MINSSFKTCKELGIVNYKDKPSFQTIIPSQIKHRLKNILHPGGHTIPDGIRAVQRGLRSKVNNDNPFLILGGASDNHFRELQAMIENYHEVIFPAFDKIKMVIYDLGLSASSLIALKKNCRCQVLTFPFKKLPKYFRSKKKYAWKPLIISAHLPNAEVSISDMYSFSSSIMKQAASPLSPSGGFASFRYAPRLP